MEAAREAVRTLGGAGLVAIRSCGHWWSYPVPMGVAQMHDFADLNYRQPCPFCVAAWRARRCPRASPPVARAN